VNVGRDSSPADGEPLAGEGEFSPNRLDIHPRAWIAPGVVVVGDVRIEEDASIWYGSVLRGDLAPIHVGRGTNVQDLTVIHVDRDMPARIGARVTVGHRSVIHGCTVEDEALIGMGAVLLNGCRIGRGAFVGAGAVVGEGFEVPEGMFAAGVPARIRGRVDEALRSRILDGSRTYITAAEGYRAGRLGGGRYGRGAPAGTEDSTP